MTKLTIIGIGARPLDARARQAVMSARIIVGPGRLCALFAGYAEFAEMRGKIKQIDVPDETMAFIRESFGREEEPIVLLASGDPFFFGIGRRVVLEFGRDVVEVIPDVSSVQLAFSRIKAPWDDALLVSLHGKSDPGRGKQLRYESEDLPGLLATHPVIAVLTDGVRNPAAIAATVASASASPSSLLFYVCERLGYDDEKITEGSPEAIAAMSFGDPNVVIIKQLSGPRPVDAKDAHPRFGLREEEMSRSGGLITKDEVRAVALHSLRLPEEGVLWDIGAGSGAVSIEAARLCPGLRVFAVERDEEQLGLIRQNRAVFDVRALTVVSGEAPGALASLPVPDRVFIGGSGGKLREIIDVVQRGMKSGIVVVNAATIETLHDACRELQNAGYGLRISEVSVARAKPVGDKRHMAALNPVFVITGEKT